MKMKDLDEYYGKTASMADLIFTLHKTTTEYGIVPVWRSSIYNIYAPLEFEDLKLVVEVTIADEENKDDDYAKCIVGGLKYRHKVPDFDAYVTICAVVIETLLGQ